MITEIRNTKYVSVLCFMFVGVYSVLYNNNDIRIKDNRYL